MSFFSIKQYKYRFLIIGFCLSLYFIPIFPAFAKIHAICPADMIIVVKHSKELYVVVDNQIVKSYSVALGENPTGHKQVSGDGKTPEGLYYLSRSRKPSNFYKAINISYPNACDKANALQQGISDLGNAIMIHGLPNKISVDYVNHPYENWTDGCIALNNHEIDELLSYIKDGTPIVILP